jgi:choline dehydrogenase
LREGHHLRLIGAGIQLTGKNDWTGNAGPPTIERMESWDYIVVGAGSAGCIVARRLSDDPSVRVLLLEAGEAPDDFWIRTPAGMAKVIGAERFDWRYMTEPNPQLEGRLIPAPRGKALGGSSAINGMVYTRGNRRDYDHWASLGNTGWSWDDVLPYFKRLEDNARGASELRGEGGPMKVGDVAPVSRAVLAFVEAAGRCGISRRDDLSVAGEEGAGRLQATIHRGLRQTAYDAYIAPVRSRRNLIVRGGVHVTRVNLNGGEATGVEVLQGGAVQSLKALREVVVCTGALNSPQLLMLSGIGNGDHHASGGGATRVHSPGVGQNLQDHCSVHVKASARGGWSFNASLSGWRKYWEGFKYVAARRGYLTASSTPAAAFTRSGEDVPYADLEIGFRPITFTYAASGHVMVDPVPAISANVYRVRPSSRGEVRLKSGDPMHAPVVHTNFMSAPDDMRATIAGIRQIREIFSAAPLAAGVEAEITPGPALRSDEALEGFIRKNGKSAYHPAGTCRMGRDAMSVVDERLRVRGVGRLRVIDASIMPVLTSGNTAAPSMMIGEKGAAMLIEDARY